MLLMQQTGYFVTQMVRKFLDLDFGNNPRTAVQSSGFYKERRSDAWRCAQRQKERRAAGREDGGAGGVKREQRQWHPGKKTSVDSDRKKTEAAHVPMSPPPDPPTHPPSTADKHMWADNMTLPVKRGRDRQREKERGRTRSLGSPDIPESDS